MRKPRLLFLMAMVLAFSACDRDNESTQPNMRITFQVDSMKVYEAKGLHIYSFIFSPLNQYDKIWTTSTANPHALDLKTGLWMPLAVKFGDALKRKISNDGIWKDDYTGETYISCLNDGLIRYYPDKDTFDFLKIYPVTAFHARPQSIVLGTANGLYFLNRLDNSVAVAENFPLEIRVGDIQALTNDSLLVNKKYYYHVPSKAFGNRYDTHKKSQAGTAYNGLPKEIAAKLPANGFNFYAFSGVDATWYYSKNQLLYTKNKRDFYEFPKLPMGAIQRISEDEDYLYVMFGDKFLILNKDFVVRKSIAYDAANHQKRQAELVQRINSLEQSEQPFETYLVNLNAIYTDQKYAPYTDLQHILQNIPSHVEYRASNRGIKNLNVILENDSIPGVFKYSALKGLCRKYTIMAQFDTASAYFRMIKKRYPSTKDECLDTAFPCVTKAAFVVDSLRNKKLPPDEFLFWEAATIKSVIPCSCWFGDNYWDFSLIEERYKKIRNQYPTSNYADDAEFWLINHQNYGDEGTVYTLNQIPEIRKFAHKYPHSDLIPALLLNIAISYSIQYADDAEMGIKYLDQAIQELQDLKSNYPLDSIQQANVALHLTQFKRQKSELISILRE